MKAENNAASAHHRIVMLDPHYSRIVRKAKAHLEARLKFIVVMMLFRSNKQQKKNEKNFSVTM